MSLFRVASVMGRTRPASKLMFRSIVSVGDTVPINYVKDAAPITIKEDKEYPEWLFNIADKGASKAELIKKATDNGVESLSVSEMRRLKRLLTLDQIKEFNLGELAKKA